MSEKLAEREIDGVTIKTVKIDQVEDGFIAIVPSGMDGNKPKLIGFHTIAELARWLDEYFKKQ